MIALERRAQARPPAMEQDALVRLGNAQRGAYLFRGPSFDVAQRDNGPLRRRQRGELALQEHACLFAHGPPLRRLVPRGRWRGPETARAEASAVGLIARLELELERRERHGALVARAARLGAIDQDAADPRAQAGAPFELVDPGDHRD